VVVPRSDDSFQKYIHDDDFTKDMKETATSNVHLPPTSRSGSHHSVIFCMPSLNKLVILEGWKAQSLSAQNQSMAAGVFGRDF